MIRQGGIVLSAALAELVSESDEWEVEITRWQPELAATLVAAGYAIARTTPGMAAVRCSAARKEPLLALVVNLGLGIGSVRQERRSLEDLYMAHVGEAPRMANGLSDLGASSDRRERPIEATPAAGPRVWVIAVNTLAEIRQRRVCGSRCWWGS